MNAIQCKVERRALEPDVRDLAALAQAPPATVTRFGHGEALLRRAVAALQIALDAAGRVFPDTGANVDGGAGVRLRGDRT